MEYLRGKIKSRTPSIGTDDYNQDSWRTRSVLRRRDDIYNSAYSRPSSSSRSNAVFSSKYKSPITNSYGSDSLTKKYSSYSPSPLQSPKIVRTRKLSILDNIRNSEIDERKQSEKESPYKEKGNNDEDDQVNYKELYEKEKKEKEVKLFVKLQNYLLECQDKGQKSHFMTFACQSVYIVMKHLGKLQHSHILELLTSIILEKFGNL